MSRKKPENLSFEEALNELEQLVQQLENGDLTLEHALQSFERGVALMQRCQKQLEETEQKVQILTEEGLQIRLDDFSTSNDES